MLKNKICLFFLLFTLVFSFQAIAQNIPPGKWWQNPKVIKSLDLTGDQIKALEKAYANSRRKLIQQKNRVEAEQFELQNMFDKNNFDENAVKNQYLNVEKARKELSTEQFRYIMKVRKIIGYDKYNRLKHGNFR